ncbi:MAG: hypothetical protein LBP34_07160 [Flavobacteriaceae bacterium]|jgi:hypothetical protein|nr:hypothetical protein [Flavobacteriaceae bacterium]
MKIGDRVNILDEEGIFIIQKIEGNKVILTDPYGFEHICSLKKVIPYESLNEFYNNSPEISIKQEDKSRKKKFLPQKKEEIREVDLHIGNLVDTTVGLHPHQMLQKQLNKARIEIQKAKKDGTKKLILIHGKGKGVLKTEIYKLLETVEGIEYFEADIIKYRFGAVEIRIG